MGVAMASKKEYGEYVTKEVLENIPKWKRQGQKDTWIAKKIGIGITTLKKWKKNNASFASVFKKGTEDLLMELEETLYTRAKGSFIRDKEYMLDKNGKVIKDTIKVKEKFIWSDSNLQFALKKLNPERWGDNEEDRNLSDPVYLAEIFKKLPEDKLEVLMNELNKSVD